MTLHVLQAGYQIREYRIEKLLGEGGFGLTYLAFDTLLKKQVAIKEYMLSEHAIRDQKGNIVAKSEESQKIYQWGLKAFLNEAQTLAQFKHPNIVTIHRFFEANGTAYIVMEYCEGQCLIDKVSADKPLAETEVKRIIAAITNGLQLIHGDGILHRDIKPDNIMFRADETPVLIDFGAARQAIGKRNRNLTTIVTPGYAPLEQYSTQGNIGPWSDIYSLSAVAYLCLVGQRPPDIMNRLHDDEIINLNQQLGSSDFLSAIDKGLSIQIKDRPRNLQIWSQKWCDSPLTTINDDQFAQKYDETTPIFNNKQTQNTTKTKLKRFSARIKTLSLLLILLTMTAVFMFNHFNQNTDHPNPIHNKTNMIAVLPLVNNKPDPDTDFLGFALADQIIGQLNYFNQINVRPSSSVRQINSQKMDPLTIAQKLNVDYILTGHYLKIDDVIRINCELIEVTSNQLIWRESFDFTYETVFELQDKVANKLSQKLSLGFTKEQFEHNNKNISSNPIAYEYYLRSLSYPLTLEGDQMAVAMLENAIQLETDFAASHFEIGRRLNRLAVYGLGSKQDFTQAKQHLLTALSIDPNSLRALRNLATFYTETGEIIKALEMTQRMLRINPNHADAFFSVAYIYRYAGMLEDSLSMVDKAIKIDPKNMKYHTLGVNYFNIGQYNKALEIFEPIKMAPFGLLWHAFSRHKMGQDQQALEDLDRLISMEAGDFYSLTATAYTAIIDSDNKKGIAALKQLEQSDVHDAEALYYWASFYTKLGDKKSGLRLLKKAVDYGYFNIPFMEADDHLDSLRSDEAFKAIMSIAQQKHINFKAAVDKFTH